MPQVKKEVTIGEHTITVRELKVKDIWEKIQNATSGGGAIEDFKKQADDLLKRCAGITTEDLKDMYPSEIRELWQAIQEVNADFFAAARIAGLDKVAGTFLEAIKGDFLRLFVGSSKEDMGKPFGITAGLSS